MFKRKDSILKSHLFLRLFLYPSAIWVILSIISMAVPDEPGEEPLTWIDLIIGNTVILIIWFAISFIISLIISKLKKEDLKEVQYSQKKEEKIIVEPEKQNIIKEEKLSKENAKKLNNSCLYTCENSINIDDYMLLAKYFPEDKKNYIKNYCYFMLVNTLFNIIASLILLLIRKNFFETILFFIFIEILIIIQSKSNIKSILEKNLRKNGYFKKQNYEFYNDYFLLKNITKEDYKIYYDEIIKAVENDTHFYLIDNNTQKVAIISKNKCELELINFIRKKISNIENHLSENTYETISKKLKHRKLIKNLMIILFIITIITFFIAFYTLAILNEINPQNGFNFIKNNWVLWCFLPISLASLILGVYFKKRGIKCTKNIVAGSIVSFSLLIYGAFYLAPTFSEDYSKINDYKAYIDAILPENGELEIIEYQDSGEDDKTEYVAINAYYNKQDVSKLITSIEESNNWLKLKKVKSELKTLLPFIFTLNKNSYISIYNKTTKEYNTIPSKNGEYEIYAMQYDIAKKQLRIHKYKYNFQK